MFGLLTLTLCQAQNGDEIPVRVVLKDAHNNSTTLGERPKVALKMPNRKKPLNVEVHPSDADASVLTGVAKLTSSGPHALQATIGNQQRSCCVCLFVVACIMSPLSSRYLFGSGCIAFVV